MIDMIAAPAFAIVLVVAMFVLMRFVSNYMPDADKCEHGIRSEDCHACSHDGWEGA